MRESLALLGYAVLVGAGGAVLLKRADWPQRAPRLGVMAWQTLSGSVLAALLLAGLSVTVPDALVSASLADLLHACVMALRAQYATPGGAVLHAAGAMLTLTLAARIGYLLVACLAGARRARTRHLAGLRLAARRDPALDAFVLDHPAAAAYCLPGRVGTVVLTSAALAVLDGQELSAVLAHERAHLRGRHHLVLAVADALARAVPFLPVFGWARAEQARLLEMLADDDAARGGGRLAVARALVRLAEAPTPARAPVPAAGLAAADLAALTRVHRLIGPDHRLGPVRRAGITAVLVAAAALPVAIAVTPAAAARQLNYCPISVAADQAATGTGVPVAAAHPGLRRRAPGL